MPSHIERCGGAPTWTLVDVKVLSTLVHFAVAK